MSEREAVGRLGRALLTEESTAPVDGATTGEMPAVEA